MLSDRSCFRHQLPGQLYELCDIDCQSNSNGRIHSNVSICSTTVGKASVSSSKSSRREKRKILASVVNIKLWRCKHSPLSNLSRLGAATRILHDRSQFSHIPDLFCLACEDEDAFLRLLCCMACMCRLYQALHLARESMCPERLLAEMKGLRSTRSLRTA